SAPPTASTQACATLASERCAGNEDHLATPVALTGEPPCFLSDAMSCDVSGAENDITATAPGATWTVEFVATPPPCPWEAPAPTCAPAFAPARLVIQAGDTVVWQVTGGLHTVTFPAAGTSAPPLYLPAADAAGTLNSLVAAPRGGMVYDGTVLVGSGLLDERTPVYQLTFPQPGHYVYVDLEHPGLAGEVIVLPAAGESGPLP
ncbi:MAG: cupredoxin domain-containing protein, partial [Thermomicrobiales bacterium]